MAETTTTTSYSVAGTFVPLKFGTTAITGYIVEDDSVSSTAEKVEIKNETGNIVCVVYGYGKKSEYTINVIPNTTATKPTAGGVFTIGTASFLVDSINVSRTKEDVEKWEISGTAYDGVTFSS